MADSQDSISQEIWKEVSGYPDYDVSNLGRVRSWRNNRHGRSKFPKILRPGRTTDGVWTVCLSDVNKKRRSWQVGRLVLTTFVGPCPEGMECCHWDDNSQDSHLSNVRWDTRQGNCDDRTRNGKNTTGSRHGMAKLTENQVIEIRNLYKTGLVSPRTIAEEFNVTPSHIRDIIKRKMWKHI